MTPSINIASSSVQIADSAKTMELLRTRIRQRGNLPGFSKAISAIMAAMHGEDEREFSMTKTVLSDPTLTQRVLRLANSAMYSVFGQNINTVSKAVIVLGTDAIGHLALGLKLVEGLATASNETATARAEMEKSVLSGHIARQVASSARVRDVEEVVVCSMLHSLGRMMVVFYLPEHWTSTQALMEEGIEESHAARRVLGLGLDEIGQHTAKQWGLPSALVNSIRDFPPEPLSDPLDHDDWLAAVSTMSTGFAGIMSKSKAAESADEAAEIELANLASGYQEMLGIETPAILAAIETAKQIASEEKTITPSTKVLTIRADESPTASQKETVDGRTLLVQCVADMKDMVSGANSGQMIAMALETIYKGLALSRAICFLHHPAKARYEAGMFFGEGLEELLPKLVFGSAYQPDVFHAALANDKIVLVENPKIQTFASKLPRWWKESLTDAGSFIALPLTVNCRSIGFIYGDWNDSVSGTKISPIEIGALDDLRAIVASSIAHRRKDDPNWMA
jgi:HD-like signal output (HDOD) protein